MKKHYLNPMSVMFSRRGFKDTGGEPGGQPSGDPQGGGSGDSPEGGEGSKGSEGAKGAEGADPLATDPSDGLKEGYEHITESLDLSDEYAKYHATALNHLSEQFLDIASNGDKEERAVYSEAIQKVLSDPNQFNNPSIKKLIEPWIDFLKLNVNSYAKVLAGETTEGGGEGGDEGKVDFKKEGFFSDDAVDFTKVTKDNLGVFAKEVIGIKEGDIIPALAEMAYNQSLENRESAEAIDKYTKISSALEDMPFQLKFAVGAYLEGKDWIEALKTEATVTEAEFGTLDEDKQLEVSLKLTGLKLPEGVTKENNPEFYQFIIDSGKLKYDAKRAEILKTINGDAEAEARRIETFNLSIKESIANLKSSFKGDIKDSQVKKVEKVIKDGIPNLFMKDGKLLPDAAEKIAYVLFFEDVVKNKATKVASSQRNKIFQEVVTTPQSKGANRNTQVPSSQRKAEDPHVASLRRQIEEAKRKRI